jgi:hypothetical protein
MRKSDGFCDLTFMAKSSGKLIGHYMENNKTKDFLEELKSNIGNFHDWLSIDH